MSQKLFERIILSYLLFFLEPNSILSPHQAVFWPGQSTLDRILYLSQSFWMGLTNPSRALERFSLLSISLKLLTVWHPALSYKPISASLPFCFAHWTQSFLSDRCACVVFQNLQICSFPGVLQGSILGPVLFSLFINNLHVSLPSSVSCSLYADHLAIQSSSRLVPVAVEATQGALIQLEH